MHCIRICNRCKTDGDGGVTNAQGRSYAYIGSTLIGGVVLDVLAPNAAFFFCQRRGS